MGRPKFRVALLYFGVAEILREEIDLGVRLLRQLHTRLNDDAHRRIRRSLCTFAAFTAACGGSLRARLLCRLCDCHIALKLHYGRLFQKRFHTPSSADT